MLNLISLIYMFTLTFYENLFKHNCILLIIDNFCKTVNSFGCDIFLDKRELKKDKIPYGPTILREKNSSSNNNS